MESIILNSIITFFDITSHKSMYALLIYIMPYDGRMGIESFILNNLFLIMLRLSVIVRFWALPYVIITFISQKERKLKQNVISIIDALCVIVLFLCTFYFAQSLCVPSEPILNGEEKYVCFSIFRKCIALIFSMFYSICMNFRLLKKYFFITGIQKYQKVIYRVILGITICLGYFFCHLFMNY